RANNCQWLKHSAECPGNSDYRCGGSAEEDIMVFRRFRGQPTPPEPAVIARVRMHEEEDGWAEVEDVKQRSGTATTDEEGPEGPEAETWDWALEGSSEGSAQWMLDDFLVAEPPSEQQEPRIEEPAKNEIATERVEEPPVQEPVEEHGYRCRGCNTCIFRGADILSSNYQAMTGPGYLIDATQNTVASEATQTVMYTTGSYVIREVSCELCDNKLGVTYVVAPEAKMEYKVGKFLLGADRLILPPGVTHPKVA
ncbi:unnamed protein product, partial [Effrenium voratum]